MPPQALFALLVALASILVLAFTSLPADLVLLSALALFLLAGLIEPVEALSGFSNEGTITIAALFVLAAGLKETGALSLITTHLFGRPQSIVRAQARLIIPVTVLSAFLNNTPVVATFMPAVIDWARKQRISVSKLLMPLSFAAIFGGSVTLIGTSTNLVIHGLIRSETNLPGFGFFELAWVGVPCAAIGTIYVLFASRWLLPTRIPPIERLKDPREYTVEMIVDEDSPLNDLTIEEAGLRHLPGLFLIEIDRNGQVFAAVSPSIRLKGGDRLVFAGITESVVDLQKIRGLKPATDQVFKLNSPRTERTLIEAVLSGNAPVCEQTVREGRFRSIYGAVVIAVAREGQRVERKIGDIKLHPGDTLLLEADSSFVERHNNSRDFLLLRPIEGSAVPRHERGWLAWLILGGMILAVNFRLLDLVTAALAGAVAMILSRCCSIASARKSIELDVILVIAASFGIGIGLQESGAADFLSRSLLSIGEQNSMALLATVYATTVLLTALVTNNASAILMFPLAHSAAAAVQADFMPFAIAIAMGASASFATPISYQTNLMVYNPGGYHFRDYLRFGLPLNLLLAATTLILIPRIWPLYGS